MKKLVAVVLTVVVLCGLMACTACYTQIRESPDDYTLEQHIAAISERIEERYFGADSEYTGYKLYPLYNEKDELTHFLVEMEPYGFAFVKIRYTRMSILSLYGLNDEFLMHKGVWYRYRICVDGVEPDPYQGIEWKYQAEYGQEDWHSVMPTNHRGEMDADGQLVVRTCSPYKLANILDQRLYLLPIYHDGNGIPAIKKGDKFFNLISLEEFEYNYEEEFLRDEIPSISINVPPKGAFDL